MRKWFTVWWWHHLWECWRGNGLRYSSCRYPANNWKHFCCRVRGHPCGVWWHNPGGFEPDMRCRNCGDDLG